MSLKFFLVLVYACLGLTHSVHDIVEEYVQVLGLDLSVEFYSVGIGSWATGCVAISVAHVDYDSI